MRGTAFELIAPAVAALTAIASACAAIWFIRPGSDARDPRTRLLLPLSGGLLLSLALIGLMPEVAQGLGWLRSSALAAFGFLLLAWIDRAVHSDGRRQPDSASGKAIFLPLVAAAAIHALVDGWGLVTVELGEPRFAVWVTGAILVHKIPEGLALGTILRTASKTPAQALWPCLIAQAPTLLGGVIGLWMTPTVWVQYPLGVAAGTFVFLGVHALRANLKSPYRGSAF